MSGSFPVGYAQTIPAVDTPGITLKKTSVSSVGHSYPYPDLLQVLYASVTNTWCAGISFYDSCEFCGPVPKYPDFFEFCNTFEPYQLLL